jgi:hypothetical protein
MQAGIIALFEAWKKRNIEGIYLPDRRGLFEKLESLVPADASVGFSGSKTLTDIQAVTYLEASGRRVINHAKSQLTREQSVALRREGALADYYLTSANAIACTGELVFFSAYGHRIAGISFAPHVLVICGTNKIAATLSAALGRAREHATPLNCRRLNWQTPCALDDKCHNELCVFPEYKRMCCQVLVLEGEPTPGRLTVMLIDEALGF